MLLNNNPPQISVIIISFNQQNVIGRAIDSVLVQKKFVKEIIISDDCSEDNTWQIIKDYQQRHPTIIRPFRHEKNLGIFGNLESTWTKPNGDLIMYLAGDDTISDGFFERIINEIKYKNIDFTKGSFCLYSDSRVIRPNGSEKILSNHLIAQKKDAKSLKIRGLIGSIRGIVYSKELFERFIPVKKSIGIYTDGLYDIQVQMYSDQNYYIDFVGATYFSGIGIASRTPVDERLNSMYLLYNEYFKTLGLSRKDKYYLIYKKESISYLIKPTLRKFFTTWSSYLRSMSFKYPLELKSNFRLFMRMLMKLLT